MVCLYVSPYLNWIIQKVVDGFGWLTAYRTRQYWFTIECDL